MSCCNFTAIHAIIRNVGRIFLILISAATFQTLIPQIATSSKSILYVRLTTKGNTSISGKEEKHLCTRDEIRDGAWKKVVRNAPPYVPTDKRSICYGDDVFEQPTWTTWDWSPFNVSQSEQGSSESGCLFNAWDNDTFCKVASGIQTSSRPTLAIVGDSLSFEQYSSLSLLLGLPSKEDDHHAARRANRNIVKTACNWTILYRRSDRLELLPSVVEANDPNVIVINRGAHYVNDGRLESELKRSIQFLQSWQKDCTAQCKTCWLFVRTTVPGHPNCGGYTEPSNSKEAMEALVGNLSNYAGSEKTYHWWDMKHQNELVLDLFSKSGLQYQVIDAYELNILRPDHHRPPDCLHSCYPGKMDVYNQLLLHFLRQNLIETRSPSTCFRQEQALTGNSSLKL